MDTYIIIEAHNDTRFLGIRMLYNHGSKHGIGSVAQLPSTYYCIWKKLDTVKFEGLASDGNKENYSYGLQLHPPTHPSKHNGRWLPNMTLWESFKMELKANKLLLAQNKFVFLYI